MTDLELLQESTRGIIHVCCVIISVQREITAVANEGAFADRALFAMLEANYRLLNSLVDLLVSMDADTDGDAWLGDIVQATNERCLNEARGNPDLDIGPCMECGEPTPCAPQGLALCDKCAAEQMRKERDGCSF